MSAVYHNLGGGANSAQPPRLLDRMRQVLRTKHYAYSTEQTYVQWARRYILFHNKRHPQEWAAIDYQRFHFFPDLRFIRVICGQFLLLFERLGQFVLKPRTVAAVPPRFAAIRQAAIR